SSSPRRPIPGAGPKARPSPRTRNGGRSKRASLMSADASPIVLSIVLPCLNEEKTLGSCLDKIHQSLKDKGLGYEIIVADNGSCDGSPAIAAARGARVVKVAVRGYGAAIQGGIAAAQGSYVIFADADDTYLLEQT